MRASALVLLLLASGCALAGRPSFDLPVIAGGTGATEVPTADGGTVALAEARIRFADLRLEAPPSDDLALASLAPVAALWTGTAHAHPGHDAPGAVAGELLGTFEVDAVGGDVELGLAPCYAGRYATGRLDALDAVLAGTHVAADGTERPFRLEIAADQTVVGIPFPVTVDPARPPDAVVLRFDPAAALAHVDWTEPDTDGDGTLTAADGTAENTTRFGVVATPTWSLALD